MTTKQVTYRQALIKGRYVDVPGKDKMVRILRTNGDGVFTARYYVEIPAERTKNCNTIRDAERYARDASKRLGLPVVKSWEVVEPVAAPALPWFIAVEKDIDGLRVAIYGADAPGCPPEQKWRHFVAGFRPEKIDVARLIVAAANATQYKTVRETAYAVAGVTIPNINAEQSS